MINRIGLIGCLTIFFYCISVEKNIKEMYRREMYIDYQFVSFQGSNQNQNIYLEIDSTRTLKYWGKIIINNTDTTLISGYEKGGFYPTWYKDKKSNSNKMIDIWCNVKLGHIPENIVIMENDSINGIIKGKTILHRQSRTKCH